MSEFEGFATISQGDKFLTSHAGRAVTIPEPAHKSWRIQLYNAKATPPQYILILTTGLLAGADSGEENVLTLGYKTEDPGLGVFVGPVRDPPSENQLWSIVNPTDKSGEPPNFSVTVNLQTVADGNLWAGTSILPEAPKPLQVDAAQPGNIPDDQNKYWELKYFRP